MNDILQDLQKWLSSNGIDKSNADEIYKNIDAGDLITLITAFSHKDYDTVAQIYNKTKAEMSSNFGSIKESYSTSTIRDLESLYKKLPISSYKTDYLSEAHLRTLLYDAINEGIVSSMNAAQSSTGSSSNGIGNAVNQNTQQIQQSPNTQQSTSLNNTANSDANVTAQQKQQILKQDPNTKVTFGGISNEDDVLGTQFDQSNPDNSVVVVKDPDNQNQVKVLNINDINLINQDNNG